jgi:hypothetical protein
VELSVDRRGDDVIVIVRDHGPGLPACAGEALFERFWRSEGGRSRGRGGAGLGLAIADAIVNAHLGTISADDAPGGGARFVVTLPAAARATDLEAPTSPRTSLRAAQTLQRVTRSDDQVPGTAAFSERSSRDPWRPGRR